MGRRILDSRSITVTIVRETGTSERTKHTVLVSCRANLPNNPKKSSDREHIGFATPVSMLKSGLQWVAFTDFFEGGVIA